MIPRIAQLSPTINEKKDTHSHRIDTATEY